MKPEFLAAAKKGTVVKNQRFETAKGTYEITIVRHRGKFYMFKLLEGKLVECTDLNKED
jgi:hypothetical protein